MPHLFRTCRLRRCAALAHFRVYASVSARITALAGGVAAGLSVMGTAALLAAPDAAHAQTPPSVQTSATSLDEMWDADLPEMEEEGALALEAESEDNEADEDDDTLLAVAEEGEGEEGGVWTGEDDADGPLYELAALTVQGAVATDYTPVAPPSVGGPMGLTVKETAQAVSVVTEQRMQDQGLKTATDVMKWVPGVNIGSGASQEGLSANARGYSVNNLMIDGQSVGSTGGISGDLSLYESVEVLRGAAGLFAGSGTNGSPGGAISLTRKKPTRSPQLNMSAGAGTWDNYTGSVDVSGPLAGQGRLRGRGIVSWTDRKFDYDFAYRKNFIAGLSLDLDITPDTMLSVGLDMEDRKTLSASRREAFRRWDGSDPGNHQHGRGSVMPWGGTKREQYSGYVKLDHVFANDWNIKLNYTRKQYRSHSDYTNISSSYDGDTQEIYHYLSNSYGKSKNWDEAFSADFTGDFKLLGQEHKFVFGYNYQSSWSEAVRNPGTSDRAADGWYYGYNWDDYRVFVDFDNLDYSLYPRRPNHLDDSRIRVTKPTRQSGVYTNLRLKLLDALALTGGARLSRYQRDGNYDVWENPINIRETYKQTDIFTPFAALSYDLNEQHTAHISYSEIFTPQNRYGPDAKFVPPLTGENKEIGLKSDWNEGRLSTALTIYQLDRMNGTWDMGDDDCNKRLEELLGRALTCYGADNHERVRGVDFELTGQLTENWNVSVGASWLKSEYLKRKIKGGETSSSQGEGWSRNNPTKQLKIWSLYRLPGAAAKWRVGVGMQTQDRTWWVAGSSLYRRLSDYDNTDARVERPSFRIDRGGYTIWNAMVSFDISKTWQAQLNVENLTNKRYLHSFNRTTIILNEPRNFNLTLTGRFQ